MTADFYYWQDDILILRCHIQPGARQSSACGSHDGRLKLRIAAPAVAGKANSAVVAFLAENFKVRKSQISITSGGQSRQKTLKIIAPKRLPDEMAIHRPSE